VGVEYYEAEARMPQGQRVDDREGDGAIAADEERPQVIRRHAPGHEALDGLEERADGALACADIAVVLEHDTATDDPRQPSVTSHLRIEPVQPDFEPRGQPLRYPPQRVGRATGAERRWDRRNRNAHDPDVDPVVGDLLR